MGSENRTRFWGREAGHARGIQKDGEEGEAGSWGGAHGGGDEGTGGGAGSGPRASQNPTPHTRCGLACTPPVPSTMAMRHPARCGRIVPHTLRGIAAHFGSLVRRSTAGRGKRGLAGERRSSTGRGSCSAGVASLRRQHVEARGHEEAGGRPCTSGARSGDRVDRGGGLVGKIVWRYQSISAR